MTIELLKSEAVGLSRFEKIEFLRFLAELLADEETQNSLTDDQLSILRQRRESVRNGTAVIVSGEEVTAKMNAKYGTQN